MIADIDKDGSGTIDFEEFLQVHQPVCSCLPAVSSQMTLQSKKLVPTGRHVAH